MKRHSQISGILAALGMIGALIGFDAYAGSKSGSSRVYNMLALDSLDSTGIPPVPGGGDLPTTGTGEGGIEHPGEDPPKVPPVTPEPAPLPKGLPLEGAIRPFDDDARASGFHENTLPGVTHLMNERLSRPGGVGPSSLDLDPGRLRLKTEADVRVYFVGENTPNANVLGFTTDGSGRMTSPKAKTIFPNASSPTAAPETATALTRTASEPLLPGDFVDVGRFTAGTQLDFFLIADGARGGSSAFSSRRQQNPDGLRHMVRVASSVKNSPYLLLAFEDQFGGGDRDYDDLLFAVDLGCVNVAALTATPEPTTWLTMGSFLGLGLWVARRQNRVGMGGPAAG